MRITRVAAAAVLALGLAGCSASSGGDEPDQPTPTEKAADSGSHDDGPPRVGGGVADPGSLADFECGPDDHGRWSASGTIDNSRGKADYRITIVVAPASAAGGQAREITLAGVGAGESQRFDTEKLPTVAGDEPTCTVRVARLDGRSAP